MYDRLKTRDVYSVYYASTLTSCKIIYYEYDGRWRKRLREISFKPRDVDPVRCVTLFKKIANSYGELLPYEDNTVFENGVYLYYKNNYKGKITALDMNSAYLWALSQPLADYETRTECSRLDVWKEKYDYYSFENDIHKMMYYKKDVARMNGAMLWADVKIYGYKASRHYVKTANELYRLKCEVNKERYKNVANIAIGCMHKRSGQRNNATLSASLYAFFSWHIDYLVDKFEKKGYNVIMVTTDSIKIVGDYHEEDNLVKIGNGLGEFKYEYVGEATYYSSGHYEEATVKWKGCPEYMRDGYKVCNFIDYIEEEKEIYEIYAIV